MVRTALLSGLAAMTAAVTLLAGTAGAQDVGGLALGPGVGMGVPLVPRQPVFVNAAKRGAPPGAMVTNPAVSRKSVHQQAIAKIRGDAGFLAGFHQGQPLAPSRQPPIEPLVPNFTFIEAPFIVNNINSALNLTFGDGNISGQDIPQEAGIGPQDTGAAKPPATNANPNPASAKDGKSDFEEAMFNAGPLPHLPQALANGGVQFSNVGSTVNVASGQGNIAFQKIDAFQKVGRK